MKHFPFDKSSPEGQELWKLASDIRAITHKIHAEIRAEGSDPVAAFDDGRHCAELILSAQLLERHVK